MKFHEKLQKLCDGMGWNKKTLAERAGVSPPTAGRWAEGSRRPDMTECLVLARLFGVTMEWLADDDRDFEDPGRQALGEIHQVILSLVSRLSNPTEAVMRLTHEPATTFHDAEGREFVIAGDKVLYLPKAAAPTPPRRIEAWGDVGAD